jgi:F0F1-type ATP synthase assembly protein I
MPEETDDSGHPLDDIEARFGPIADKLDALRLSREGQGPKPDGGVDETHGAPPLDAFDSRLREIKERSQAYSSRRESTAAEESKRLQSARSDARGLSQGLQIAYTIIGLPLIGFGIGVLLDHEFGTQFWKGFAGLAGCALAVLIAMFLINRANQDQ